MAADLERPRESPALRAAFLATSYGPLGQRFRLDPTGPGQTPPWGRGSWAVLTAWNPQGLRRPARVNRQQQAALHAALHTLVRQSVLTGVNGDGHWAEPALIVPGITLAEASALGRRFGQAAVLFGVGRRVALVWTGSPDRIRVERFWVRLDHGKGSD